MVEAKNPPLCALCGESVDPGGVRVSHTMGDVKATWHFPCWSRDDAFFDPSPVRTISARGPGRVRRET